MRWSRLCFGPARATVVVREKWCPWGPTYDVGETGERLTTPVGAGRVASHRDSGENPRDRGGGGSREFVRSEKEWERKRWTGRRESGMQVSAR